MQALQKPLHATYIGSNTQPFDVRVKHDLSCTFDSHGVWQWTCRRRCSTFLAPPHGPLAGTLRGAAARRRLHDMARAEGRGRTHHTLVAARAPPSLVPFSVPSRLRRDDARRREPRAASVGTGQSTLAWIRGGNARGILRPRSIAGASFSIARGCSTSAAVSTDVKGVCSL